MKIEPLGTYSLPGTPCPECKAESIPITLENLTNYLYGRSITCPKCNVIIDWWTSLLRHFEWKIPSFLYSFIGAVDSAATIWMKANETVVIDMKDLGIPPDARILQVAYSPNGKGLWPIEVHRNIPIRHFIPHKIEIFGKPHGESNPEQIPVVVSINWVPINSYDQSLQNYSEAIEAYSIGDYESFIIPANVAVEYKLYRVLHHYLSKFSSAKRVTDFLDTHATYSYQLNILLPLIANHLKFPQLPDHIRGHLNSLRDYRNDIAHKGKLDDTIDKTQYPKLICSSFFGLGYVVLFEAEINRSTKESNKN
ncbi:MAG: hypothetical protein ABSD46_09300 [Bacteroidota bacterium]